MVTPQGEHLLDPSLRVLALPLAMLDAPSTVVLGSLAGLPAGVLEVASANLVLAATPCDAPLFRTAMEDASRRSRRDVVLVRTGLFPETLNPVTVEVALAATERPLILTDLLFCRWRDGTLWLVPTTVGPSLAVNRDGLDLRAEPLSFDADERSDALCRAAAEIVRIVARRRSR